jgi:hypothetical protein
MVDAQGKEESLTSRSEAMNNFKYLLKFVLSRWLLLLIVGLLAGIAGIIYSISQKAKYKSHLTFALDDSQGGGNIGNLLNLASQFGLNVGSGKDIFAGDNILQIMKSRRIIENVLLSIDTFDHKPYTMIEYYLEITEARKNNPKIQQIRFPVNMPRSEFTYQQDSLLYKTYLSFNKNNIIANRPDRKLSIYEVNVISPNEKFTKDFTDSLVAKTNDFYTEIRTKKAKETLDILEKRASTMKENLNSSFSNKANVQDVNVNPAFSKGQVPMQKQQANIQVYGAAYGEMFKDLELARFQYLNEIPLMQIIDQANYPMEKIKSGKLSSAVIFAALIDLILLLLIWLKEVFTK